MGPRFAAEAFRERVPHAALIRITLYGSLAATGKGHLTDRAVSEPFKPIPTEIVWDAARILPLHPNGLKFEAFDAAEQLIDSWTGYSVGGGALMDAQGIASGGAECYPFASMQEILETAAAEGRPLWAFVEQYEGREVWVFLETIWQAMQRAIERGINADGVLPGELRLARKASSYHAKALNMAGHFNQTALLFSYALAVSEENASGGEVVTAPTCGASGVLPAVLHFLQKQYQFPTDKLLRALATAGLIGNLVKRNASISGAEVGCQGEVGVACAMAAGAAAQLLGGSVYQIEYAAEMGLEHHLGLTCDPIGGYVQIPCIERNAIAAARAVDCAAYALLSDGRHVVSFDEVVKTMLETGKDMKAGYRETAEGGLAKIHFMKRI
ncbi:L-serine ammonia-lyase [Formivibrio citricus]|uniref:L-serine dehydratase n=2 Tax=Formivibrio citricus TaxID=83765 RepID=A0A1I4ZVZ8_9NEIS|nr:L-serine ammonia-lyase [Formivibrio citricus]